MYQSLVQSNSESAEYKKLLLEIRDQAGRVREGFNPARPAFPRVPQGR